MVLGEPSSEANVVLISSSSFSSSSFLSLYRKGIARGDLAV